MSIQPLSFSKEHTALIKGIAILFMIMHHCLIPEFYDVSPQILHNYFIIHLMIGMRICVGLFTFIIGYGYAFQKTHSYSYSFKHIWRLISRYWFLFIVLFYPVSYYGGSKISLQDMLMEMFGIHWSVNCASWYVYFYIFMMILLPCIADFIDKNIKKYSIILIGLCILLATCMTYSSHIFILSLQRCFFYLPVLICGYVAAKQNWIVQIKNKGNIFAIIILLLVMVVRCAADAVKGFATDIVLVPLFIYSVLVIYTNLDASIVKRVLISLGKASFYMWFLHAVFYSVATRYAFSKYVLWTDNIFLSFILVQ